MPSYAQHTSSSSRVASSSSGDSFRSAAYSTLLSSPRAGLPSSSSASETSEADSATVAGVAEAAATSTAASDAATSDAAAAAAGALASVGAGKASMPVCSSVPTHQRLCH